MTKRADVPPAVVDHLRAICERLPETREETAWVGTRWRIRAKTFAHALHIEDGWPPAYARAASTDGPATVLMLRSSSPELEALVGTGHPFFSTPWRADEVGMVLDDDVDWTEIAELVTESYCLLAPQHLAASIDRPPDE